MTSEKIYVNTARTNEPGHKGNPHSKNRIASTVGALQADGYFVTVEREIIK